MKLQIILARSIIICALCFVAINSSAAASRPFVLYELASNYETAVKQFETILDATPGIDRSDERIVDRLKRIMI